MRTMVLGTVALSALLAGCYGSLTTDGTAEDSDATAPEPVTPCEHSACWETQLFTAVCGTAQVTEDFSTGNYNVHAYDVEVVANKPHDFRVTLSAGDWEPALLVTTQDGQTLFDGVTGLQSDDVVVTSTDSGDGVVVTIASVRDLSVVVHVTGWRVVDSDYGASLPMDAVYQLRHEVYCEPGEEPDTGILLSPPNFDPDNVVGGYYLLPSSQPSGLYERKADDCSRGNKLLIDVIYTAATHWQSSHPSLSPFAARDLNEGSCSTVNHATHNDGTHADLVAGCGTSVSCNDQQPAIDLAKLFVDTGAICGILFNNTTVQDEVNAYFASKFSYEPWNGKFMRTVSGHTSHFHVRVKKPDGSCN